jgi:hypothetical protein
VNAQLHAPVALTLKETVNDTHCTDGAAFRASLWMPWGKVKPIPADDSTLPALPTASHITD